MSEVGLKGVEGYNHHHAPIIIMCMSIKAK